MDFTLPNVSIGRDDPAEPRGKALAMSYVEWRKRGFSKGTLHQLKAKAQTD